MAGKFREGSPGWKWSGVTGETLKSVVDCGVLVPVKPGATGAPDAGIARRAGQGGNGRIPAEPAAPAAGSFPPTGAFTGAKSGSKISTFKHY